jgi:spore germination protein YaaH
MNEGMPFRTEQDWDHHRNRPQPKRSKVKKQRNPAYQTLAWHLFSMGSAYQNYNFEMLSAVCYFSFQVNPETGAYHTIHQWKSTSLVDSARRHGTEVYLSVSNFGTKANATFLTRPHAWQTLADSLTQLLTERNAHGVNIDFEGVPGKYKMAFTHFIQRLSQDLKQKNPQWKVSLCLYAKDWHDIFNIPALDAYIDLYTLMGYDYYGSFSKTTGPVTPFVNSPKFGKGLQSSVQYYLDKGVRKEKLIVGLPYYGAEWYTSTDVIGSQVDRFRSHPPYSAIRKYYLDSMGLSAKFDTASQSSYLILEDPTHLYRQLFFESDRSLSIKFQWIKDQGLAGPGVWALGYDEGYSQLWDVFVEHFSIRDSLAPEIR